MQNKAASDEKKIDGVWTHSGDTDGRFRPAHNKGKLLLHVTARFDLYASNSFRMKHMHLSISVCEIINDKFVPLLLEDESPFAVAVRRTYVGIS